MTSLREAVKDYQEELRDGIAWVVFWREGRSWKSDYLYLEVGSDTINYDDIGRWKEICGLDPRAVALNGYYCGHLAEDMSLDELAAGVRWHYENGFNSLAAFIEAHSPALPPEQLEEARQIARAAGLPFSEKPYDGQEFDPYVYDGSMTPEDYELMQQMIAEERSEQKQMSYHAYDHDKLEAADTMRIERTIYFEYESADISALTALPLEQLQTMREESAAAEQAIFENLQQQAAAWEEQAGKTLELNKAIEYARTPETEHTANEWTTADYDRHIRSNRVYQMSYHIYENTRYDRDAKQSVPYSWTLSWSVRTNSPNGTDRSSQASIAGQQKKVFSDKAAMEKYLNGRIKAYSHLFTEISPPIPQEYAEHFKVNGQLLPGYTIEDEKQHEQAQPETPTRPDPEKADMDAISTRQAATLTAEPPQPRPVVPIVLSSEKPAEKMKEITERLEQGIQAIFESERYKEYLRVMSKFHDYSLNNTLLIAMQKPDASLVAGFSAWKNKFERSVKKGEKGIKIIAPSPFKVKQEMEKIDPDTQKPVVGRDGKPITEEREITIPAYKVVSVFDVSQTEGKEIPDISAENLVADVEQYEDFFKALEKTSPVPIAFEQIEGGANGYYHLEDKRIAIDEGISELQTLKTAIHEIAHARLHDVDLNAPKDEQNRVDRRTREVQAESVAYAVCQHFGLDTSEYSFAYVAGWSSGKEMSELKASLETIQAEAKELITEIEGHFTDLQQQRETAEPQHAAEQSEQRQDTFSIYQLKGGDETRDLRFEPYDRLQAAGLCVNPANYEHTYSAPLETGMTLESIYERFNIDHPADFKGHSLSVSDIVVLHQNGQDTAHYVDSIGYRDAPEFLKEPQKALLPDDLTTGESIKTPRGSFHVTDMTREQIEAAGYGFHHQSEDGKYLIMANGTQAFAVAAEQPEKVNPLKHIEDTVEQNDNNFDGIINNTPQTPTVAELEQRAKAGEAISLTDLAKAVKADKREQPPKKRSVLKQLDEYKKQAKAQPQKQQREQKKDLEV